MGSKDLGHNSVSSQQSGVLPGSPRFPEHAFMRYFEDGYLHWPSKIALMGTDETITYSEAYVRAKTIMWCLKHDYSIGPGSTVALASPNIAGLPIVMAAVQACGAMLVMCSNYAELVDYTAYARLTRPDLFIVCRPDACAELARECPDVAVMTLHCECEGYPAVRHVLAKYRAEGVAYEPEFQRGARIVLFSSGSTGAPKAIVNRFESFHHNGCEIARGYRIGPDDVMYLPVPLFHSYGMIGLYAAFTQGATIVTLLKYRPDSSLATIESARVSVYFGVPTMYLREMRESADGDWDFSSLRVMKLAGSACPEEAVVQLEEHFGCKLLASYGMTETAATCTMADYDAPLSVRASSVGVPIDGVTLKIDADTGELLVKSVSLMDGILREDGSLDAGAGAGIDEDGWFHSGDVAAVDADGNYHIVGRIKDIIIRGGVNIFPVEIENAYQQHEGISESCLVGYPDPDLGERTCLCVIEAEGHDEPASSLRAFAIGRLEKWKVPDVVMKMESLPRLASGKTDKKALQAFVIEALHKGSSL